MKKLFVGAAMVGGGIVLFFLLRSSEPSYQGKRISAWLDDWAAKKTVDYPAALRHVGSNALPYAVRNLALNDSRWRNNYCKLQPKLPNLLRKLFPKPLD
jgi:hypothetical protein